MLLTLVVTLLCLQRIDASRNVVTVMLLPDSVKLVSVRPSPQALLSETVTSVDFEYCLRYGDGDVVSLDSDSLPRYSFAVLPRHVSHVDVFVRGHLSHILDLTAQHDFRSLGLASNVTNFAVQTVGPVDTQFNLVFVSNGYLAGDFELFKANVTACTRLLADPGNADLEATIPILRMFPHINVFGVFQPSAQVGASDPATGVTVNTNLMCAYGTANLNALQCDVNLVTSLAATAPASVIQQPHNTVVIVLVNSAKYGGTGIYRPWKVAAFFNGFDLTNLDQKLKMASLMYHELGHAIANLMDEYEAFPATSTVRSFPNCAFPNTTTSLGATPLPYQPPPPWAPWLGARLPNLPSGQEYGVDSIADMKPPCGYANYVRPSGQCMMNKLTTFSMCPVCREQTLRSLYTESKSTQMLTWPRCPHSDELVLLQRGEFVWLFASKALDALRDFEVKWMVGNRVLVSGATSVRVEASWLLQVPSPDDLYVVSFMVNDTTPWVLPSRRQKEMSQISTYRIRILQTTETVRPASESCIFSSVSFFAVTSADASYRSECQNPAGCRLNFTASKFTDTHNFLRTLQSWDNVLAALVVIFFALAVVAWCLAYYFLFQDSPTETKKLLEPWAVRLRLCIVYGSAIIMLLCVITIIVGSVEYEDEGPFIRASIGMALCVAAALYFLEFLAFWAAFKHSKAGLITYAILLFIVLVPLFFIIVVIQDARNTMSDPTSRTSKTLEEEWKSRVLKTPSQICYIQKQLSCSGWTTNCGVITSSSSCPEDCDEYNDAFTRPCRSEVIGLAKKHFSDVFTLLVILLIGVLVSFCFTMALLYAFHIGKNAMERLPPKYDFESLENNNKEKELLPVEDREHEEEYSDDLRAPSSSISYTGSVYLCTLPAQIRIRLQAQFDRFDTDMSGNLDRIEFFDYLRSTGKYEHFTSEDYEMTFRAANVSGSSRITPSEFERWHEREGHLVAQVPSRNFTCKGTELYQSPIPAYVPKTISQIAMGACGVSYPYVPPDVPLSNAQWVGAALHLSKSGYRPSEWTKIAFQTPLFFFRGALGVNVDENKVVPARRTSPIPALDVKLPPLATLVRASTWSTASLPIRPKGPSPQAVSPPVIRHPIPHFSSEKDMNFRASRNYQSPAPAEVPKTISIQEIVMGVSGISSSYVPPDVPLTDAQWQALQAVSPPVVRQAVPVRTVGPRAPIMSPPGDPRGTNLAMMEPHEIAAFVNSSL